jgi:polyisoprenoid-binding protein YceI
VRRRAACAALATALAAPNALAAETYVIDPAHTFASFSVDHLGIATQRGRFDRSRGRAVLDREARTGTIEIEIDSASVSTGNAQLDALLRSDEFFDSARQPAIRFHADQVEFDGGQPRAAAGELTLLGVTRPVTLAIGRFGCTRKPFIVVQRCGADATATMRRSEFGLKAYASFVGDEVGISIQVEAILQEPPPAAGPGAGGG